MFCCVVLCCVLSVWRGYLFHGVGFHVWVLVSKFGVIDRPSPGPPFPMDRLAPGPNVRSSGSPGFTRQPENSKRTHLSAPALQTPPKFQEKDKRDGKKNKKTVAGEGKKARNFGPHGSGPHPSGPHPSGPTLRTPSLRTPPTSTQNTQKNLNN